MERGNSSTPGKLTDGDKVNGQREREVGGGRKCRAVGAVCIHKCVRVVEIHIVKLICSLKSFDDTWRACKEKDYADHCPFEFDNKRE